MIYIVGFAEYAGKQIKKAKERESVYVREINLFC